MAGPGDPRAQILRVRTNQVSIDRKVSSTVRAVQDFASDIQKANQRSVERLSALAAKNLDARIRENRYQDRLRTGQLRRAILNPASHAYSKDNFRFMIKSEMYRQAKYYRVIEEGSRQFVGRRIYLIFGYSTQGDGLLLRAPFVDKGRRTKGKPGGRSVTTIRRPIPDYRYAEEAIAEWTREGFYRRQVFVAAYRYQQRTGNKIKL